MSCAQSLCNRTERECRRQQVKARYLILARKAQAFSRQPNDNPRAAQYRSTSDFFGKLSLFSRNLSLVTIRTTEDIEVMMIFTDVATTLVKRKPSPWPVKSESRSKHAAV